MDRLKKLKSWISAYENANGSFPDSKIIKLKINELLKDESKVSDSKQIFFRESQWSDYQTLRLELSKDLKFVKEYSGVDLKVYIEEAVAWSEKGNKSTDLGWILTLRNWMRKAKSNGTLIKLKKIEKTGFINH